MSKNNTFSTNLGSDHPNHSKSGAENSKNEFPTPKNPDYNKKEPNSSQKCSGCGSASCICNNSRKTTGGSSTSSFKNH